MDFSQLSQWRRAAFSAALASKNMNHILLFSEMQSEDASPATKLANKIWAFLDGELKSIDNLERFFNEFDTWQSALLQGQDSFGAEAAQQACQSLYSAAYALLDESANDCELLDKSMQQLFEAMAELSGDEENSSALKSAYQDYIAEVFELLNSGSPKREVIKQLKSLATSNTDSLLGISLD